MGRGDRSKHWKYSFSDRKPTKFEKRMWTILFHRYRDAKAALSGAPDIKDRWHEVDPNVLAFDVTTKEKLGSAGKMLKVYLEKGWCPKLEEFSLMREYPIPVLIEGSRLEQKVCKSVKAGLRTSRESYNRRVEEDYMSETGRLKTDD